MCVEVVRVSVKGACGLSRVYGVRVCIEGVDEGNGVGVGKKVPSDSLLQQGRGERGRGRQKRGGG